MRKESSQSSSEFHWECKEHVVSDISAVVFSANKSPKKFFFQNTKLLQTSVNVLCIIVLLNSCMVPFSFPKLSTQRPKVSQGKITTAYIRKFITTKPQSVELLHFLLFYLTVSTRYFTSIKANKSNGQTDVMLIQQFSEHVLCSNEMIRKCMQKKTEKKCEREKKMVKCC